MTAHLHATFVDGCYRCDLNRDELESMHREIEFERQQISEGMCPRAGQPILGSSGEPRPACVFCDCGDPQ
jgi:hypothetical protein